MTMQSDGKHHSLNNLWAQLAFSAEFERLPPVVVPVQRDKRA